MALASGQSQFLAGTAQFLPSLRKASPSSRRPAAQVPFAARSFWNVEITKQEDSGHHQKHEQGIVHMVKSMGEKLAKPALAGLLALLLLQHNPESAMAAGGGRVGGRVGGGGSSFSSKSYSAPSRSYSGGGGGYAMPRQYIAPNPGFSYAVPYAAPSPFFGPSLYAAPAYGIGLGGGSVFFLVILGFIMLQAIYGFVSERSEGGSLLTSTQKFTVLKLQVSMNDCSFSHQFISHEI